MQSHRLPWLAVAARAAACRTDCRNRCNHCCSLAARPCHMLLRYLTSTHAGGRGHLLGQVRASADVQPLSGRLSGEGVQVGAGVPFSALFSHFCSGAWRPPPSASYEELMLCVPRAQLYRWAATRSPTCMVHAHAPPLRRRRSGEQCTARPPGPHAETIHPFDVRRADTPADGRPRLSAHDGPVIHRTVRDGAKESDSEINPRANA